MNTPRTHRRLRLLHRRASTALWFLLLVGVQPYLPTAADAASSRLLLSRLGKPCPAGCEQHGVCNPEIGECMCPRIRSGPACQSTTEARSTCLAWGFASLEACKVEDSTSCLNGCNGRGVCKAGFCHCQPGYYGSECSLSLRPSDGKPELLAGLGYKNRKLGPKVYVYELPGIFHMHRNVQRVDRPLHLLLTQRLTGAGVRVADGDEADYYLIPVKLRMFNDGDYLTSSIEYIRQRWPWWDQLHGHRHLIVHTGDLGRAELNPSALALAENATFLTHWGLYENQYNGNWPLSHRPGKDIVIPIFLQPALVEAYSMQTTPLHPLFAAPRDPEIQFYFAGRICQNRKKPLKGVFPNCDVGSILAGRGYSAGTRQRVHYYHHDRPGYKIVLSSRTYALDMARARFCLAPTGGGHGKRNVLVSLLGCIPVTMTDYVLQPFEPELNWNKFSVHVAEADIPRMHKTLAAISEPEFLTMQKNLRCAAQHLFWSSMYGSIMGEDGRFDAFETIMAILRSKLKYPDVRPEQLAVVDPELGAFMKCQPPPGANATRILCTHTPGDMDVPACKAPGEKTTVLMLPGGAICKWSSNLAQCPRLWE